MGNTLDEVTLIIPDLWDKPWDEYIADADGLDRKFLSVQAGYARLLRQVASVPVTPARLGFLSLWSRFFGSLTGARGAAMWESRFAMSVNSRVALEAFLHLQAIMLPVLEPDVSANQDAWHDVRKRLAAYVAWTLHADSRMYHNLLLDSNLDEAFAPAVERRMAEDMGAFSEVWEGLTHHRPEIVSDEEAAFDKVRAKQSYQRRLDRIERWLCDDRLSPWRQALIELESAKRTGGVVTLFGLLGLKGSVASFAKHRGGPLGYFNYSRGSGFIHGSSFEASMMINGLVIAPDFANLTDDFADCAQSLLRQTGLSRILLMMLATKIDVPVV